MFSFILYFVVATIANNCTVIVQVYRNHTILFLVQCTLRGGSRIYKGGGLTQSTTLLGGGVQSTPPSMLHMLELEGSAACPPQENFEIQMLKYCNLETFPHKMHISACRYFIYRL